MIDTNILYKTHLTNMAPQRGFITSYQPYIMVLDVDLNSQIEFNAQIFNDNGKRYIFLKDGPARINPNQNYIQFNGNSETIDFIKNAKFLSLKTKFIDRQSKMFSFKKFDFDFKEVLFEKEITENSIKLKIPQNLNETLLNKYSIMMTKDLFSINPSYDLYLGITNNESQNLFYQKGEDYVMSYI